MDSIAQKKILITGAAGFIGSHMAERLLNLGYEVLGVDNFSDYYSVDLKTMNAKSVTDNGIGAYTYDGNGNMRTDAHKGMTVDYNHAKLDLVKLHFENHAID